MTYSLTPDIAKLGDIPKSKKNLLKQCIHQNPSIQDQYTNKIIKPKKVK